jgi:3-oxoacyl-[acyl-carrier-protein] synthase-3
MDVNTACTSFLYGLSTATAMIRSGVVKSALVVGVELISPFMDWANRNVAVLFGDGAAAVVLQASERDEGCSSRSSAATATSRDILRMRGMGGAYATRAASSATRSWQFDGQEIFKKAVHGMSEACEDVLARAGIGPERHRPRRAAPGEPAHHRFVAKRAGVPMERVFVNVQRYGNMSAATVPVALVRGARGRPRASRARCS